MVVSDSCVSCVAVWIRQAFRIVYRVLRHCLRSILFMIEICYENEFKGIVALPSLPDTRCVMYATGNAMQKKVRSKETTHQTHSHAHMLS
jgi:hypothetical protein